MKETLGFICLALILATPTKSLSADVERAPDSLVTQNEEEMITVDIRSRMFIPRHVHLHHDRKTVLRFLNHDTELHTVAAKELFLSAELNVSGNGFPEFGPDGLKRVIIPPDGLAEFRFTPTRTGTFSYLCDMPGHEMKAVIVIE